MSDNVVLPVILGLLVGIALIAIFIFISDQQSQGQDGKLLPKQMIWVAKNTTQCDEAWDMEFQDNREELHEGQTPLGIFLDKRDITIYDIEAIPYLPAGTAVCAACGCTSGSTLYLKVDAFDVTKMTQYGFTIHPLP